MKQTDGAKKQLELLLQRYPILAGQRDEIDGAYQIIAASYGKARNWGRTLSSICRRHCRPSLWTVIRLSRRHMQTTAPR